MLESLRRHLPVLVTAVVVALLMQGGPPVVAAVRAAIDADTVDGRSAVGAGASPTKRAGKLVATDGNGRLPSSIIAMAPDSARLGGLEPDAYLRDEAGSVTSEQIADRSVMADDLHLQARIPQVYGAVRWDGELLDVPTRGLQTSNVTVTGELGNTYCLHGLDAATAISVSPTLSYSGPSVVYVGHGPGSQCAGVEGTQFTVTTYSLQTDAASPASFNLQIW